MLQAITWQDFVKISSPQYYVLLVTAAGDKINLTGISWYTIVSWEPPLVVISIRTSRYGYELLKSNQQYVICFPSQEQMEAAAMCGQKSGRKTDKVKEGKFVLAKATQVNVPLIVGSTACLECVFLQEIPAGDHRLIVGQVKAMHGDFSKARHLYTTSYRSFYALDHSGATEK